MDNYIDYFFVANLADIQNYDLKGAEIPIYFFIKGLSQDGVSVYCGGHERLALISNTDKRTVGRVINRLIKKGLIYELEDGKTNDERKYRVYLNAEAVKNIEEESMIETEEECVNELGGDKMSTPGATKCPVGGDKMSTPAYYYNKKNKNKDYNININNNNIKSASGQNQTAPDIGEICEFKIENNLIFDTLAFLKYYESISWMKNGSPVDWKNEAFRWGAKKT